MESPASRPMRRLLLLTASCALALVAFAPHGAFGEEAHPLSAEASGTTTAVPSESDATTTFSESIEQNIDAASSIDKESTPETFSGMWREFVPFNINMTVKADENQAMLDKVNNLRASKGLNRLSWNDDLTAAAEQRAAEIAFLFDHNRPNGDLWYTVSPRLANGENILMTTTAAGAPSADAAFSQWYDSPGHYGNMVNASYESIAVGHAVFEYAGMDIHLWVQLFSTAPANGNAPTNNYYANFNIPLAPDAAKSVYASPNNLLVSANGSFHPSIVIEYQESSLIANSGEAYLLIPGGSIAWGGLAGDFKASNPNVVSYDQATDTLWGGKTLGKTNCTVTLATAPSLSCSYSVTNSPFARLAGESSDVTAAQIAAQTMQDAGKTTSEYAIIARNDDFADAMSATGLAGTLDAPILLTSYDYLSDAASVAIDKLGVEKVYIVGGPGALFPEVESSINAMGVATERVYGEYSWDTSLKCAEMIHALGGNPRGEAIVTTSTNFQDALSVSPLAYRDSIPILLQGNGSTIPRELTEGEFDFIAEKTDGTIWVPSGPVAVTEASVEGILGKGTQHDREIKRMWGEDGYDTSLDIAQTLTDMGRADASSVVIASGAQGSHGVDALAGAALAGVDNGVILLVNANPAAEAVHTEAVDGYLLNGPGGTTFMDAFRNDTAKGYMLGGSFVMPYDYEAEVAMALADK